MHFSPLKKLFSILGVVILLFGGITVYHFLHSGQRLAGIAIAKPAFNSTYNGIARISAKFVGPPLSVKFIFKNDLGEVVKEAAAYFENDTQEWVYYLNSMEFANGNYVLEALGKTEYSNFRDSLAIKINNDGNSSLSSTFADAQQDQSVQNDKASSSNDTLIILAQNEKIEEESPQISTTNNNELISSSTSLVLKEDLLNGVIKALSNIYDTVNNNLNENATENNAINAQELQPKVAGATAEKNDGVESEMKSTTTSAIADSKINSEQSWFSYNLQISNVENQEIISDEKILAADCDNPLDTVEFILDDLETPEIDYTLKAVNNYGYYTYWTYKLNPKDIAKGQYLLYAKGTIDWHTYESPLVLVNIK